MAKSKRPTRRKPGKFCLWVHRITEARTPEEPYSRSKVICYPTARKLKEAMRAANRWLRSSDEDAFFVDYKSSHFKRGPRKVKLTARELRRKLAAEKRDRDRLMF
jgi:hypothetical protein